MKRNLIILITMLLLVQLIQIDTTTKDTDISQDFIKVSGANEEMTQLIGNACYDCHSNETAYPWYAKIAPVSWWIGNHIHEGREHLNFSEWSQYDREKQKHKLEGCADMVKKGEMPMKSFTWLHPEARMNHEQKQALIGFFNKLYAAL